MYRLSVMRPEYFHENGQAYCQGNVKVVVSGGQKSPSTRQRRVNLHLKKGEDFEMSCFSLNARPKFPPPFSKGGQGRF